MNLLHKIAGIRMLERAMSGELDYVEKQPGSDRGAARTSEMFDAISGYAPQSPEGSKQANQSGAFDDRSGQSPENWDDFDKDRRRVRDENRNEGSVERAWREHEGFESNKGVIDPAHPGPAV